MKIVTCSPVIIEKGKLLVSFDDRNQCYKLPGGRRQENETDLLACIRGFEEETGLEMEIGEELPVIRLNYDPKTGKPTSIQLHHFIARLVKKQKKFVSYNYQDHEVCWIPISHIKEGRYEVSHDIKLLIERGDIK